MIELSTGYICGFIGAGLTLTSYTMKSMMPLRMVALAANFFFVAYGWLEAAIPSLVLYSIMIPINAKKGWEIHKLVSAIKKAKSDTPLAEWLLPHMTRCQFKAGQFLWKKGDIATDMFYVESGILNLVEYKDQIRPGSLIGEIGLLSPDNQRTLTLFCETDCVLYRLSAEGMAKLYYQNPKLGFHVVRLVVARLMKDIKEGHQTGALIPSNEIK